MIECSDWAAEITTCTLGRTTIANSGRRRAIFLDRDGTIIVDRGYLGDPAGVELLPGAAEGMRRLATTGLPLVVLTNQSGIGRGLFPAEAAEAVHARLAELLAAEGIEIAGWYLCPHLSDQRCGCRKPATGMARRASNELGLDIAGSFVLGDQGTDLELASAIGAYGILVARDILSPEAEVVRRTRSLVAADLIDASKIVRALLSGP